MKAPAATRIDAQCICDVPARNLHQSDLSEPKTGIESGLAGWWSAGYPVTEREQIAL
jgi:hypothetical protein